MKKARNKISTETQLPIVLPNAKELRKMTDEANGKGIELSYIDLIVAICKDMGKDKSMPENVKEEGAY